jgi:hypothetical protein
MSATNSATVINNDDPDVSPEDSDTDMPDAQQPPREPPSPLPPSTSKPTSKPNQRSLDIASLCNPMVEIPEIRQHQTSSLFDENLDAVHKPSSIKDCSCEQLSLVLPLSFTKCTLSRN